MKSCLPFLQGPAVSHHQPRPPAPLLPKAISFKAVLAVRECECPPGPEAPTLLWCSVLHGVRASLPETLVGWQLWEPALLVQQDIHSWGCPTLPRAKTMGTLPTQQARTKCSFPEWKWVLPSHARYFIPITKINYMKSTSETSWLADDGEFLLAYVQTSLSFGWCFSPLKVGNVAEQSGW